MASDFSTGNLKEKITDVIEFTQLLEDPTRMKILFLFFLHQRLSLTQLSDLVHRTKPAISHQLKKFIKIGIIKITKQPVRGMIMANFYELVPDFLSKAVVGVDPTSDIPREIIKDVEVLQIRAEKEVFNLSSNIFLQFADFYSHMEKRAQEMEEPFGTYLPPFNLTLFPLSSNAYQYFAKEMVKIQQTISKMTEEENQQTEGVVKRPMLYITSVLPIKDFLSHIDTS